MSAGNRNAVSQGENFSHACPDSPLRARFLASLTADRSSRRRDEAPGEPPINLGRGRRSAVAAYALLQRDQLKLTRLARRTRARCRNLTFQP